VKYNVIIGSRTRDIPACSALPQPTLSMRSVISIDHNNRAMNYLNIL